MSGRVSHSTEPKQWLAPGSHHRFILATVLVTTLLFVNVLAGCGQSVEFAPKPYLGWSSFSQQTISKPFLTQANITAQSDALLASGLQSHGFNYINMDSGWHGGFDANGRPLPNLTTFPDIVALVAHKRQTGKKLESTGFLELKNQRSLPTLLFWGRHITSRTSLRFLIPRAMPSVLPAPLRTTTRLISPIQAPRST